MIEVAREFAAVWGPSLWRASWQGGIVLAGAWAIVRWCTFLSPRVVCWVWRLACLKLLVALVWLSPIPVAVLPPAAPVGPTPVKVAQATPTFAPEQLFVELDPQADLHSQPLPQAELQAPAMVVRAPVNFSAILLPIWLAGVMYCVYRSGGQWQAARRLVRSSAVCSADYLLRLYQAEAGRIGVRRLPRLQLSSQVEGPILVGVWRPAILLPAQCEQMFAESELRLMLAHELTHCKRHDLAWNWLPTVSTWLFFFHPLVWLMTRCWSEAQEAACDEALIQRNVAPPAEYGRLLLKLAALSPNKSPASMATAGVLGAYRNLERRILTMAQVRPYSARRVAAAATALLLTGVIAIVPWRLVAQEQKATMPPPEVVRQPDSPPTGVFQVEPAKTDPQAKQEAPKKVYSFPIKAAPAKSDSDDSWFLGDFHATAKRAVTVRGRATNAAGEPMADVTVYLVPLGGMKEYLPAKTTTNAEGEYELRDYELPLIGDERRTGSYQIYGVSPGKGIAWQGVRTFFDSDRSEKVADNKQSPRDDQVFANDKPVADLKFAPAGTLRGRLIDEFDKPIIGAKLDLLQFNVLKLKETTRKDDHLVKLATPITETTDADGRFQVACLADKSEALVKLTHPDFGTRLVRAAITDDAASAADRKDLIVGDVNLTLPHARKVTMQLLYGDSDKPAVGARVGAGRSNGDKHGHVLARGVTDASGVVVLSLPPGQYSTDIKPDRATAPAEFVDFNPPLVVKEAPQEQTEVVRLPSGCKLEIEIVDADSGQPVPNIDIVEVAERREYDSYVYLATRDQTDAAGKFQKIVPPGKHRFTPAPGRDYHLLDAKNEAIEFAPGKTVSLKFKLRKQLKADATPEGKPEKKPTESSDAKNDKNDPALTKALARLKELGAQPATASQIGIQSGWKGTDADLKLINDLPELKWLYVDFETPGVDGAALAKLQLMRPVDHLILDAASNELLEKLPQLPPCKTLLLPRYSLTEPGFDRLAKLSQGIESLQLMQGISDAGLQPICQIRSLKKLQIVEGGITDAGLAHLVGLDRLEELTLIDCWKIRGTGFAKLAEIRSLRSLTALTIPIDADALKALATLTQLTSLKIQPLNKPAVEDLDRLRAELKDVKISILPYDGPQAGYFVAEGDDGKAARERSQSVSARGAMAGAFVHSAETWISRKEYVRAKAFFEEALRLSSGTGKVANRVSCNAAWFLATCPDDTCRDGRRAVELATKACEGFAWKNREAIDTLAAASAEVGDFDAAVKWQAEAIKLAAGDKKFQQGAEERLSLYRQKKPYRDPSPAK